jgi:hypothetical protein
MRRTAAPAAEPAMVRVRLLDVLLGEGIVVGIVVCVWTKMKSGTWAG